VRGSSIIRGSKEKVQGEKRREVGRAGVVEVLLDVIARE